MRTLNRFVLLAAFVTHAASTLAADLNGAWTVDASACGDIFTKKDDKFAFKPDADLHAGGIIVQGKQITGTFQKCTIKSLHDDGSDVRITASCSDGIAISDVEFDLKISGTDQFTLSSKAPVPVEMH